MANEYKNVKRIATVSPATLDSELDPQMIGMETATSKLGAKMPAGDTHYYTPDGGDAYFNNLRALNLAGPGGRPLATDAAGNVIASTAGDPNKRDKKHGFVDPEGISWAFDDVTRKSICTHSSGTVVYWTYGVMYSKANGDTALEHAVPDSTQDNWLYFDNTGQLASKTSIVWDDVKETCLGPHVKYDTTSNLFFLRVIRDEDVQANHIENYASYRTKAVQSVAGARISFTGALGDTQTGFTNATYFTSRDHQFDISALGATAVDWLNYYYNGTDDDGNYDIRLNYLPATTGRPYTIETDLGAGSGNAIYNIYTTGTDAFSVGVCPSNNYVIGHLAVADGGTQCVVALAPQNTYSNLSSAQNAIETDKDTLTQNDDIFRDVAIVASFILKGDLSGGFLDVGNGGAFYYHAISVGSGGGGSTSQSYDSVLSVGNSTARDAVHTNGVVTTTVASTFVKVEDALGEMSINSSGFTANSVTDATFQNAGTGNMQFNEAVSGNDIAGREALGSKAFVALEDLNSGTDFDVTASAGATITAQSSEHTSSIVTTGCTFTLAGSTAHAIAIFTVPTGAVPSKLIVTSCYSTSDGAPYTVFLSGDTVKSYRNTIPAGSYVVSLPAYIKE